MKCREVVRVIREGILHKAGDNCDDEDVCNKGSRARDTDITKGKRS